MSPPPQRERAAWDRRAWAQFALGVLTAGLAWLANDWLLFESTLVPSSSMRPTLLPNERVYVQRVGFRPVRRFDVVVLRSRSLGRNLVKRVVATPGECVRLLDGWRVEVDGRPLSYAPSATADDARTEAGHHAIQLRRDPRYDFPTEHGRERLCLGSDEYYVLGDNRLASLDSRVFGPVRARDIIGRMTLRWYSYDRRAARVRTKRLLQWVR